MRSSMFFVLLVSLVSVGAISIFFEPTYDRECSQLFGGKSNCTNHAKVFQCNGYDPINQEYCPGSPLYVSGGGTQPLQSTHNLACTTPIGDEPCGGLWTNLVVDCNGDTFYWNGTTWVQLNN